VLAANTVSRLMAFASPDDGPWPRRAAQLTAISFGQPALDPQHNNLSLTAPLSSTGGHWTHQNPTSSPPSSETIVTLPRPWRLRETRPRALISCLSSFISEFSLGQTAPTKPAIRPLSPPCPSGLSRLLQGRQDCSISHPSAGASPLLKSKVPAHPPCPLLPFFDPLQAFSHCHHTPPQVHAQELFGLAAQRGCTLLHPADAPACTCLASSSSNCTFPTSYLVCSLAAILGYSPSI